MDIHLTDDELALLIEGLTSRMSRLTSMSRAALNMQNVNAIDSKSARMHRLYQRLLQMKSDAAMDRRIQTAGGER